MKTTTQFLLIMLVMSAVILPCSAVAPTMIPRPYSTTTLAPIANPELNNMTNLFGGYNSTTTVPDPDAILWTSITPYLDAVGPVFFVILFALPFVMMWIVEADMTLPAIVGMLFSVFAWARLPAQYGMFIVGAFVICIAGLLWSLYKRSY